MSEEKEAKEAKNQNEEEQKAESNDSADLNSLTYEELLEQVEKQKEETLRAVAELENFRKRSTNEISNALKYANSELLLSIIPLITSLEKSIENSEDSKKIDNFVTNTLERGWTLNERVVKPALVVVNKK